ncbi:MAG: hypothetical protein H5U08_01915 [Thermogutta sp.]|uniref:hypothetical protein n=1 Tax=Thermogutta sp. TaxID=1962930 RepID=UPI0019C870CF|nr:hypothetical protein [Thermogutta sp.]MBC7351089.1 hypothetical protein [Thermogutta sp.]
MRSHYFNLRLMQVAVFCVAIGALVLSGGCGKSRSGGDNETPSVARLDVGELPGLGDPLPPLDEGRLEISPPRDWVVSPRSSRYIVRFQAAEGSPYPTVIVTAQDCQQFKNIDAGNVGAFAKFVASELASAGVKTTVKTGQIGQLVGVMYTRRARVKDALGGIVDRVFFDTVVAGRRYQFELRSPPENVGLAEPYFLAIVRGAKISGVGELEETLAAEETGAKSERKNGPSPASGTAQQPKKEAVAAQKGEKPVEQAKTTEQKPEKPVIPEKSAPAQTAAQQTKPASPAKPEPSQPEDSGKKKGKSAEDLLKEVDKLLQ